MVQFSTQTGMEAVAAKLTDEDPTIRHGALTALETLEPTVRLQIATGLLSDPIRSIRIEAARLLMPNHQALRSGPHADAFDRALADYKESLDAVADRPGAHIGYGLIHSALGDPAAAEKSYRDAFRIDPDNIESRINLSELMFEQGRMADAGALLEECVAIAPDRGVAHEALGRHLVRVKDYDRALVSLGEAARLMPDNAHIQYFYGVALNQLGQFDRALVPLQRAHELEPSNPEYLVGLAAICRDHSKWELALKYAGKLVEIDPSNSRFYEIIEAQMHAEQRK